MNAIASWQWVPLIIAALHIIEEFVWPGGFGAWYREYRPEIAQSVSTRYLVIVNAVLLACCAVVAVSAPKPRIVAALLTIVAVLFGNGVFHAWATWRMKRYSPGTVTGLTLYIPLGAAAFISIVRSGLASPGTAIVAAVMGCSYQLISVANHRRRILRT
jgi:Protein of unknown function with HXXEE motif